MTGYQSEMDLAFAGLHTLCTPIVKELDRLPPPQREALSTALGLAAGPRPDRFLVGLAVLSLLAAVADEQPVLCLVDDAQWLDGASVSALVFVARRVLAEQIGMVFAVREDGDAGLRGLPEISIGGLPDADARAVLLDSLLTPHDPAIVDRLVADTHGNPLALLELPQTMTPAELAGGFGLPSPSAVSGRTESPTSR